MQGAQLRHQSPAPGRKPVPRGASRMVAKEPMSVRLPKANFGFLKALFWPVLLVALGFGTYEGAQRLMPYADRPITKIAVQGDLSYISQQAVQQRIAPFVAACSRNDATYSMSNSFWRLASICLRMFWIICNKSFR